MKTKNGVSRIIAAVLACVLIVSLLIPVPAISRKHGGKVQYPCVLVHGLGGWGENAPQGGLPYFGVTTGSLPDYLRAEGYTVCVPSVGPFSSTWDRACELYAQLTGTRVDYGAAHAKAHNHARYGRTYDTAMVPDWGQKVNGGQMMKVDLVSHSFGGPTDRMLASLLAYGDKAEMAATGKNTSPLFTGGKADWVHSITTLCSPNNGSVLTCVVDDLGSIAGVDDAVGLLVTTVYNALKTSDKEWKGMDLMLDQFGIGPGVQSASEAAASLQEVERVGNDHAFYDLSPDGAAALNERIGMVDNVYYFSYAFCTTKPGKLLRGQVPKARTFAVLSPLARAIGAYTGISSGGIVIDETWQPNDGLVSVTSAQYPAGDPHETMPDDAAALRPGVWYVTPTQSGDHTTSVGGLDSPAATHRRFDEILSRCAALPR